MNYKLGRVPSRHDARSLTLAPYLDGLRLPAAPPARNWARSVNAPPSWGMFANDVLGTCSCASIAHLFAAQAANTGNRLAIGDADVVALYERVGHYDPTRPETDQGAQMLDVLRALREVGMAGQRISAFAAIEVQNRWQLEIAVNLFGGVYVGADLPVSVRHQLIWDVAGPGQYDLSYVPNSWGPHAMALLGYDQRNVTLISHGEIRVATLAWYRSYVTEAWALIDPLWVDQGLAPSGFRLQQLRSDLVDIHRGARSH